MPSNQITVFLDPTQLPSRAQDQATFDGLMGTFMQNLPTFGAQFNSAIANFNASYAGSAYAIPYTVDLSATSDTDPGNGKLRFDSATQNAAATLRLDLLGSNSVDYTAVLDTFDASTSTVKGTLRVCKLGDASTFLIFAVTARSAPTGYRDIAVTPIASSGTNPFVNGDGVLLFFQRTGDKGDTGAAGVAPYMIVCDLKASGTAGGTATAAAWNTRTLNTVRANTITGASLAGNVLTLPAGTYKYSGSAPAFLAGGHQMRLYNQTDSAQIDAGSTERAGTGDDTVTRSVGRGQFVLGATKNIVMQHYLASNSGGTNALGLALSSGAGEMYAELHLEKVA
jgi:hypothetical protein